MSEKTLFDLSAENFDYYFANELNKISPESKDSLPEDVSFKIFRGGGKQNTTSTSKLGFIAKLFILWKALNKRWFLLVEDEENGLSTDDFLALRAAQKKRDYKFGTTQWLVSSGTFVLASKELSDSFAYLNRLSLSPSYNFLTKAKNKSSNGAAEWSKQMEYICNFIMTYEANKKRWVADYGISMPEWLVLIYLYHGKEVVGSPIYKSVYKRAYQSSPTKLRRCFGVLQSKGLMQKTGEGNGARLSITPLGKDIVNTILTKYAINF